MLKFWRTLIILIILALPAQIPSFVYSEQIPKNFNEEIILTAQNFGFDKGEIPFSQTNNFLDRETLVQKEWEPSCRLLKIATARIPSFRGILTYLGARTSETEYIVRGIKGLALIHCENPNSQLSNFSRAKKLNKLFRKLFKRYSLQLGVNFNDGKSIFLKTLYMQTENYQRICGAASPAEYIEMEQLEFEGYLNTEERAEGRCSSVEEASIDDFTPPTPNRVMSRLNASKAKACIISSMLNKVPNDCGNSLASGDATCDAKCKRKRAEKATEEEEKKRKELEAKDEELKKEQKELEDARNNPSSTEQEIKDLEKEVEELKVERSRAEHDWNNARLHSEKLGEEVADFERAEQANQEVWDNIGEGMEEVGAGMGAAGGVAWGAGKIVAIWAPPAGGLIASIGGGVGIIGTAVGGGGFFIKKYKGSGEQCFAFSPKQGVITPYFIQNMPSDETPSKIPDDLDLIKHCFCEATDYQMPGFDCRSGKDKEKLRCLRNPYDPQDKPKRKCMDLLREDNDIIVKDPKCGLIQCRNGLMGLDVNTDECSCYSQQQIDYGLPMSYTCSQITCTGNTMCVVNENGIPGCRPMGGTGELPPSGGGNPIN